MDERQYIDTDVLTEAKKRILHLYDTFDSLWVSFSGGKDSLVVLNLVEEVYRENGIKEKPNVLFYDEELIDNSVISFVESYYETDRFNFIWLAVPLHSNKFILGKTFDYVQWDPNRNWIRSKPDFAITQLTNNKEQVFDQYTLDDALFNQYLKIKGRIAVLTGIRAQESIIRLKSCLNKKNENYICTSGCSNVKKAKPIYDWSERDVFKYFLDRQIEYCQIYDNQFWNGQQLRVSTPLHSEYSKRFSKLRTLYPQFYEQLVSIFPEMLVQERYWNELDRYSVMYSYPKSFDGIRQYIFENIEDLKQKELALSRIDSIEKVKTNKQKRNPSDHGGYPLLAVFRYVVNGQYKRMMTPKGGMTKQEEEYEIESRKDSV